MKHEEAKAAAHMAVSLQVQDYDHLHTCTKCGADVRIRVRHPMHATPMILLWLTYVEGECKACLEKGKAKA